MKNLLITQQELSSYGGSEVVTLEIADYALSKGFDVTILTNYFGNPFSKELNKKIKIIGPDQELSISEYSHIWIHHNFIPPQLLDYIQKLKSNDKKLDIKIAYHHMSPYVPIESPLLPALEESLASNIFFNSEESLDAYKNLFRSKEKVKVLGNPAPDKFLADRTYTNKLMNILVVSNHVPAELRIAIPILENAGIRVVIFGADGISKIVTPVDIMEADIIISIGKTVQYSILSSTPVYCYDHFGGSGYLTPENFAKNRYYNFSGRGFKKKSAKKITHEIISGFSYATKNARELKNEYSSAFLLSKQLDEYLSDRDSIKKLNYKEDDLRKAYTQVTLNTNNIRSIVYLRNRVSELEDLDKQKDTRIDELTKHSTHLERVIERSILARFKRLVKKLSNLFKVI